MEKLKTTTLSLGWPKDTLRLVLVCALVGLFMGACVLAFVDLINRQKTKTFSSMDATKLSIPSVTFCISGDPVEGEIVHDFWRTYVQPNIFSVIEGQVIEYDFSRGEDNEEIMVTEVWYPRPDMTNYCLTIDHNDRERNPNISVMDQTNLVIPHNESGWPIGEVSLAYMAIHERGQLVNAVQHLPGTAVWPFGWEKQRSLKMNVMYQVTQEELLPDWRCDPLNQQLPGDCLHEHLQSELGCRLPWIRHSSYENPCNWSDPNTLAKHEAFSLTLVTTRATTILEQTGCQMNCRSNRYELSPHDVKRPATQRKKFQFCIFTAQDEILVEREILTYDTDHFLADVGGYLGLLLGGSILGLYDAVLRIWNKLKNRPTSRSHSLHAPK